MKINFKALQEVLDGTSKLKKIYQIHLLLFFIVKANKIIEKHRSDLPKELLDLWDLKEDIL